MEIHVCAARVGWGENYAGQSDSSLRIIKSPGDPDVEGAREHLCRLMVLHITTDDKPLRNLAIFQAAGRSDEKQYP